MAAQPNRPASVELADGLQGGSSSNDGAVPAELKAPASGLEGYIEAGIGTHGLRTVGGAVTVPLVKGRLQLSIEGYEAHAGSR